MMAANEMATDLDVNRYYIVFLIISAGKLFISYSLNGLLKKVLASRIEQFVDKVTCAIS